MKWSTKIPADYRRTQSRLAGQVGVWQRRYLSRRKSTAVKVVRPCSSEGGAADSQEHGSGRAE